MPPLLVRRPFATTVGIGSVAAVGSPTAAATKPPSPGEGGTAAAALASSTVALRCAAAPAFVAGRRAVAGLQAASLASYMRLHRSHGELTAALVILALGDGIGARAEKVASGSSQAGRSSAILTGATLACAIVAPTFAVLEGQVVP